MDETQLQRSVVGGAASRVSRLADESRFAPFVRLLEEEARSVSGNGALGGREVVFHPLRPGEFEAATDEACAEFERLGYAWSDEVRGMVWLGEGRSWNATERGAIEEATARRNVFMGAVDENVKGAAGEMMPEMHYPLAVRVLLLQPKIKSVEVVADLTVKLFDEIERRGGLPGTVRRTAGWRGVLEATNALKVYEVKASGVVMHVVAGFVTPMWFERDCVPVPGEAEAAWLDVVHGIFEGWKKESGATGAFAFLTVGTAVGWSEATQGWVSSEAWVVCHEAREGSVWQARSVERALDRLSVRDFVERLSPQTAAGRVFVVRDYLEKRLSEGAREVRFEEVKDATGFRRTAVELAIEKLVKDKLYKVGKTPSGILYLSKLGFGEHSEAFHAKRRPRHWLMRGAFAVVGVAAIVGYASLKESILGGKPFALWEFLYSIPLFYGGVLVDRAVRRASEGKD